MFVPKDFVVPVKYKTERFILEKLTPKHVKEDYRAVVEARDHIHKLYDEKYTNGWPTEDITIEEDALDLARHEEEFDKREAFAYTVLNPTGGQCLGCVYIDPMGYLKAEVTLWTRDFEGDRALYETVKSFLAEKWPFVSVEFPVLDELFS